MFDFLQIQICYKGSTWAAEERQCPQSRYHQWSQRQSGCQASGKCSCILCYLCYGYEKRDCIMVRE